MVLGWPTGSQTGRPRRHVRELAASSTRIEQIPTVDPPGGTRPTFAQELLDDVLPADADLIMRALDDLKARNAAPDDQTPYLKSALAALNGRTRPLDAEEFLLKARLHDRLNDTPAACTAYTTALQKQPLVVAWRLEFCHYLIRSELYQQAKNEVIELRRQGQNTQDVLKLEGDIYRKIAER